MALPFRKDRGFSLTELLVVLAIIGILSVVGVTMVGNRKAGSVRALLDELEGCLTNAHKAAVATGRDVAIVNWGTWANAAPLVVAHGDASITDADIQTTANGLLAGTLPATTMAFGQTVAVPFHYQQNVATNERARIVLGSTADWDAAMTALPSGAVNQAITAVTPFKAGETMSGLVTNANNFFNGDRSSALNRTLISGSNKRFSSTFVIQVVGTSPNGGVPPGSPMGLIVVLANGASIYRFYNPGIRDGDGQWRRI